MIEIFGFYKFINIKTLKKNRKFLQKFLANIDCRGTIILSNEGINGSISGKHLKIEKIVVMIKKLFRFKHFDSFNYSKSPFHPFHKPRVKIKKEVVPMNLSLTKRTKSKNNHVEPKNWNKLIKDKNTFVIDTRKPFEYNVGTFHRSNNPEVSTFREFPKYLKKLKKKQNIAMFCTGGIRCEKASVYLQKKGFKNVYQLKGGILNYLKTINKKQSLWRGECFVFDNRVSLKHGLKIGTYSICSGCRKPISKSDKNSTKYEVGVSCPNCHEKLTNTQKERFRMRQKQIVIAKKSSKYHIFKKEY